ncbi:uncharacterized protein ATC70_007703 [Mucor velutinosus]|uniref:Uncharacterized protein n=1 Tax=Mucor velutinosus TaxID=708070 RepID=A0AAN7D384_9FUNG|nr:hypothetical protein ATC70_007703 [Mucor velutinosus]
MATLKANLHANVFASISANFCEKASASLKIRANILGAVKNFPAAFDVKVNAKIQANIYEKLEVSLRKSCGVNRLLDEIELLDIVTELETKAKAWVHVELPKIGVDLGVRVKEELEIAVNGVEVNIPLILQIAIDIGINERATLETCIDAALKVCAKLDAKASAKAMLEAL